MKGKLKGKRYRWNPPVSLEKWKIMDLKVSLPLDLLPWALHSRKRHIEIEIELGGDQLKGVQCREPTTPKFLISKTKVKRTSTRLIFRTHEHSGHEHGFLPSALAEWAKRAWILVVSMQEKIHLCVYLISLDQLFIFNDDFRVYFYLFSKKIRKSCLLGSSQYNMPCTLHSINWWR